MTEWNALAARRSGAPRFEEEIAAALLQTGLDAATPAAIIAAATTPRERILVSALQNLAADARAQKFEPPAIVVIGDIVGLRGRPLGRAP